MRKLLILLAMVACLAVTAHAHGGLIKTFGSWHCVTTQDKMDDSRHFFIISYSTTEPSNMLFDRGKCALTPNGDVDIGAGQHIQLKPELNGWASIRLRFDKKDPESFKGVTGSEGKWVLLPASKYPNLSEKFKKHNRLLFEFEPMFEGGSKVLEYNLNGFTKAYQWLQKQN